MMVKQGFLNSNTDSNQLKMLGIGLIKILEIESGGKFETIYQRGIGNALIQNVLEMYKKEIIEIKKGTSIIPLDDFTLFINYFHHKGDIFVMIYMDGKELSLNIPQIYLFTKKIAQQIQSNTPISEIKKILNEEIIIPRAEGIMAFLAFGSSGNLYFSKINKAKSKISQSDVLISGFISALFAFTKEVIIEEDAGAELKEINFGNQRFFMITKNKVIFAYLLKDFTPLINRYMQITTDDFLTQFKIHLRNFNGDTSQFRKFEEIVDQYFII